MSYRVIYSESIIEDLRDHLDYMIGEGVDRDVIER